MAVSNHDRLTKALALLTEGLVPFIERELKSVHQQEWFALTKRALSPQQAELLGSAGSPKWDAASALGTLWNQWNDVFRRTLGQAERSLVAELRDVRNKWGHQRTFSTDDVYRALDSVQRLLNAVSAGKEAGEVEALKQELLRLRFDEQVRGEKRKAGGSLIEAASTGVLSPWREVVAPHPDVATGRYQQAEFAADLWQVHLGEGSDEYRKPQEFFRRTYLTESLKRLLVSGVQRVCGRGGDPVVQLQTNFGGGKTHSMLALYHLFSGVTPSELPGADAVLADSGETKLPKTRRVVLVGNKISPGNPVSKPDGTIVRTLWGELAWQLGMDAGGIKEAQKAFAKVKADDEHATSPGDRLRELFKEYGPCLVLIDEWVAYARQLHDQSDLPAGSFETQFTFAQALTESAKLAGNCLLVISLPASDTQGSPHTQADDVEVGGVRGREALDRLRNVVGRVESSWRPATAEEGFEIVRRRLFEPLAGPEAFKQRDVTARAFADLYNAQKSEFPPECRDGDYEKRMQAAYPIHPEIFDQLYGGWSTLVKFQRTRGVLRLMAAVIHSLWEKGDRNPLILPSTVPIDDSRVQFELTRYLSDNWVPIIEKDVDGPGSLPLKIDGEQPNLGRLAATRRVARTIYLGSAPTAAAAHRGIEDRRIKLGCVMPGESPAVFGDALRRLASTATYLYQDGPRFWYSTQPTVTKLAEDRAEQLNRDTDRVIHELEERLRDDLKKTGEFGRIHSLPHSGADVPDDLDTRLVVLPTDHPFIKEGSNPAEAAAKAILEARGNTPRHYRNTLVFLAADKVRLQDLDEALRRYLAWESILTDRETLNLDPHQVRQAENQRNAADGAVVARLPETYQWLLVPEQTDPHAEVRWDPIRLTGSGALAVRASAKLVKSELLLSSFGPTVLRKHLDDVPLWRGDSVPIRQLVDDFARYTYLPRISAPDVLMQAVRDGVGLLTWRMDTFAYAESYDEAAKRFRGIRGGQTVYLEPTDMGLLVNADVAGRQIDAETSTTQTRPTEGAPSNAGPATAATPGQPETSSEPSDSPRRLQRFHGTVRLDSTRVGRDASRIADEVISHLVGQVGAEVAVTLEIEAQLPNGVTEQIVRTVTENSKTLKFTAHGFEEE